MKKKYPNLMMQSASSYDTSQVKKDVEQQVKEEQSMEATPTNTIDEQISQRTTIVDDSSTTSVAEEPGIQPTPTIPVTTPAPVMTTRAAKPRLRQQAYYLTELEIKTIKRLSYELDIPKSDLVRKFIDEGIARIDQGQMNV